MQIYHIPYNFEHEEKVFGGYVSLRQAIYLIFVICSMGLFFLPLISIYIKITVFLMIIGVLSVFAFLKIDGTNADKYSVYILKFLIRRKIYILER